MVIALWQQTASCIISIIHIQGRKWVKGVVPAQFVPYKETESFPRIPGKLFIVSQRAEYIRWPRLAAVNTNKMHIAEILVMLTRNMWIVPGGTSGKEPACQCRKHKSYRFDPWVRKMPWRRAWEPTPVFLPGESHGQKSLAGYSPQGLRESTRPKQLSIQHMGS